MPTPTYTALATVTLGSSASSVTFSSIPATYRDLILVANGTIGLSSDNVILRFNSDSGSNYSNVVMVGFGTSSVESAASTTTSIVRATAGNIQSTNIWNIMDYSATDKHKTVLSRSGTNSSTSVSAAAERWANTAAITSIYVAALSTTLSAGHTFSLYGVIA